MCDDMQGICVACVAKSDLSFPLNSHSLKPELCQEHANTNCVQVQHGNSTSKEQGATSISNTHPAACGAAALL